jgi:hypothetical protein
MVNAPYATVYLSGFAPAYDEQIIARAGRGVQRQARIWFPRVFPRNSTGTGPKKAKKEPPETGGFES